MHSTNVSSCPLPSPLRPPRIASPQPTAHGRGTHAGSLQDAPVRHCSIPGSLLVAQSPHVMLPRHSCSTAAGTGASGALAGWTALPTCSRGSFDASLQACFLPLGRCQRGRRGAWRPRGSSLLRRVGNAKVKTPPSCREHHSSVLPPALLTLALGSSTSCKQDCNAGGCWPARAEAAEVATPPSSEMGCSGSKHPVGDSHPAGKQASKADGAWLVMSSCSVSGPVQCRCRLPGEPLGSYPCRGRMSPHQGSLHKTNASGTDPHP